MRHGFGLRLVVAWVAAAGLVGLLVASSASAAKRPRTVALTIRFTGSGQLWVTGALTSDRYTCASTSSRCTVTFHVPPGRRIVLHEQPANGWHLTGGWNAACHGSRSVTRDRVPPEQSCPLRLKARRSANLTFVPPYPGEFLNPWPLGTTITLYTWAGTFALTVNSATIDANAEVEAVTDPHTGQPVNGPPPAGDQYTLVNLSLANPPGYGPSPVPDFLQQQVWTEGMAGASYKPDSCVPPPPDLGSIGTVDGGQTVTGNLCFTISSSDASTLRLGGNTEGAKGFNTFPIWFALR